MNRLLRASGGFVLHPVGYQLAPVHTWPKHAWVTGKGLLALFGAKPQGPAALMLRPDPPGRGGAGRLGHRRGWRGTS